MFGIGGCPVSTEARGSSSTITASTCYSCNAAVDSRQISLSADVS